MLGDLISAGLSLIAGDKQKKEARRAERISRADHQNAVLREKQMANRAYAHADKWAQKNLDMQHEFAKEGLRWRVEDARAAGIHPLYALGASTHSFSPVTVGGVPSGSSVGSPGGYADTGAANSLANAGQDIGRAVNAMLSPQDRSYGEVSQVLGIQNMQLQNELLMAQISSMRAGTGPGMPALTSVRAFGDDISPSTSFSDAGDFQQRYGEPAEWIMALPIAGADIWNTYGGPVLTELDKYKASLPRDQFRYHVVR